ncbi:MAG: DUF3887 domain-containing protein [Chloroflexota bacterium]
MSKMAKYLLTVFVLVALLGLTGCEWTLSGAKKDAVLAWSEAAVDNLLAGWTTNDYAAFSRDFDADMQAEITAAKFADLKQDLDNQLGNYISRRVDRVTQADEFYVVTYAAKFEQEEALKITVAFHRSDQSISFLAFNSEKVSWSTFQ